MVSLASYRTLHITAICPAWSHHLKDITAIRFDGGYTGAEEASVADFIRWLDRGDVRAYVRRPDGVRGPQIHVERDDGQPHIRTRFDEGPLRDALLMLPRWDEGKAARKPTHRRRAI